MDSNRYINEINDKRSLGQGVPAAAIGQRLEIDPPRGKTARRPAAGNLHAQLPLKLFLVWKFFWLGIFGVVVAFGVAARADDVTVTFTDDEQRALYAVFDAAVKARGMQDGIAGNVTYLWEKMRTAAEAQAKAKKAAPAVEQKK